MQAFPTGNAKPTACPGWRKKTLNTFKSWLILQGIWTPPASAVMLIWAPRCETSIYAPTCSSAAREELTAVTPCHLPVLEGGMMQEMELGTSPHAAAAAMGPLKRVSLWWGTAEHCWGPKFYLGLWNTRIQLYPSFNQGKLQVGSASLTVPWDQMCFSEGTSNPPRLCSLCSRSQRVKAGVSPPVKLKPFYISFVAFCHHHLRALQDKLQRGKLKRKEQGSDQILPRACERIYEEAAIWTLNFHEIHPFPGLSTRSATTDEPKAPLPAKFVKAWLSPCSNYLGHKSTIESRRLKK